tara:strand:- start:521 stop:832 length:312 start_codon:yes stop_codon:yes gene_type:complete
MKTIKRTKLREVLSSKGLDEGFIDRIFKRLQVAKSNADLAKVEKDLEAKKIKLKQLRNDPEYKKMKSKYNLKDVPGIDTPGKEVDLDDFLKNTQKQIKKSRSK